MSNQGLAPDDDTPELPLGDGVDTTPPDAEAERIAQIEAEARRQGWRPREEYRGVPGGWRSAEEFLRRGQDILPIVRKDLEKERARSNNMENEIKALRTTVDEQKMVMEDLLKMARTASESGYRRALDELKNKKRMAAQAGDIAAVVAIDEQISEVEEERAAAPVPAPRQSPPVKAEAPQPQPKVAPVDPIVERFVENNPWFKADPILNRAMEAEHLDLLESSPGLPLEENLERAKEAVMARYPRKFGINPRETPPDDATPPPPSNARRNNVTPPTPPANSRRQAATGIASIEDPQERAVAQQAFSRAKRQMPELTEAEWFALYDNPRADVMEMNASKKTKGGK